MQQAKNQPWDGIDSLSGGGTSSLGTGREEWVQIKIYWTGRPKSRGFKAGSAVRLWIGTKAVSVCSPCRHHDSFIEVISSNPHSHTKRKALFFFSVCGWCIWGTERLSILSEVTQQWLNRFGMLLASRAYGLNLWISDHQWFSALNLHQNHLEG